jgi:hypothetical protein
MGTHRKGKTMALDFNLLRPTGGPNPVNAFLQGQQGAMDRELARQKAAQDQEMNALRMQQVRGAIGQQEREVKSQAAAQKTGMFRERLLRARTPDDARRLVQMQYADPDLAPLLSQASTLEQALAEISDDPTEFEKFKQIEAQGMTDYLKSLQPKVAGNAVFLPGENRFITAPREPAPVAPVRQPPMVEEFVFARSPEGGGFQGSYQDFVIAREAAKRAPAAPRAAAAAGAGGAAPKPMTPVQSAKRRDQLGKEFKSAQNALQTTQDVLDSINFVKTEPGLSRATGFTGTLLPSIPEGAAASAEVRLKNLEGKVTALGKAQAASTGAIGSIANQEWKILADQIAAIDRAKGTGPLLSQLDLVEAQAQGAMERIKDAYQRQFGEDFEQFPQFADLPVPRTTFKPRAPAGGKPAAGGGLSAAEQAELDQLRKRFGK